MKKIAEKFRDLPSGTSGLGLGAITLCSLWFYLMRHIYDDTKIADYFYLGVTVYTIGFIFGIYCFISILVKFSLNFDLLLSEWKGSSTSGFLPTKWMLLIQIVSYISAASIGAFDINFTYDINKRIVNTGTIIASIISTLALILQIIMLLGFLKFVMGRHNFKSDVAYSSWFVPTVGIAIICNAYPNLGNLIPIDVYRVIWFIAFGLYMVFLPIILYNIIFFRYSEKPQISAIGVFISPGCLLSSGFFCVFSDLHTFFAYNSPLFCYLLLTVLISISTLGMFIFFTSLIKIIKLKFNPSWTALTFPSAVSATSFLKLSLNLKLFALENLEQNSLIFTLIKAIHIFYLAVGILFISTSTIVISYVMIRYLIIHYKVLFLGKIMQY
ncbi:C4-dicarboxylate ABC transporter [Mycoplasma crocodyli]|uniref:Putative membrane protein n=1 Tax=Mycoplasma crocodyli (strain ATCC 51981 / MP145) TaxID=512564 RepID=D5E4L1_MYCCM|nr:C4-dicarboxylate ABC transporter [Mycoplasma crocodyli]ADE20012.1 putative membrane protein [Mycoplasma crocodyli MP145]